jgi:hypothetical protein
MRNADKMHHMSVLRSQAEEIAMKKMLYKVHTLLHAINICRYISSHIYVYMYIFKYFCILMHIFIYLYVYIYTYIYIYKYFFTFVYT